MIEVQNKQPNQNTQVSETQQGNTAVVHSEQHVVKDTEIKKDTFDKDEKIPFIDKLTFYLIGTSSLIGWNAFLATLHYFSVKLGDRVYTAFTIPILFIGFVQVAVMPHVADRFSERGRIIFGMVVMAFMLVAFPFMVQLMPNDTGFYIGLIWIIALSIFNQISENTMVVIAGKQGHGLNSLYWTGNGFSGLATALLSLALNNIFQNADEGEYIATQVFYILCAIFGVAAALLCVKFLDKKAREEEEEKKLKTESLETLNRVGSETKLVAQAQKSGTPPSTKNVIPESNTEIALCENQQQQVPKTDSLEENKEKYTPYKEKLITAIKHCRFIPVFMFLIYVLTLALFPAITMGTVQFTSEYLNKNEQLWGIIFLNLTYQLGDVFGKGFGALKILHNTALQYALVILRYVFIPTSLLISNRTGAMFSSEWFPFVNMFLLATTNGMCTTSLFILGSISSLGKKDVMENISFITVFGLILGLTVGSFLSIPLNPQPEIEFYYED